MRSSHSQPDAEANKANTTLANTNPTWLHLIVSIHAVTTLSLCVFTALGYVAGIVPMALVVLTIFQTFMAILGLAAIDQNRQDYRSLYIIVNAVTAGSAIIWSIFLLIKMREHSTYVPAVFLIIAPFSLIATIVLIFFADKTIPKCLQKVICLNLFPFVKLLRSTNRMSKVVNTKKSETTEENFTQQMRTKEVNSNESLNNSLRPIVGSKEQQQQESSELKTKDAISEIKSEKFAKGSRIAAGMDEYPMVAVMKIDHLKETYNEGKNSATLSYVRHCPPKGYCSIIGNNWREFYSIPILNICNATLCPTGRIIDRNRLRRGLLIKKCRNKKKIRQIIPKFSPLEKNIFEHCSREECQSKFEKDESCNGRS